MTLDGLLAAVAVHSTEAAQDERTVLMPVRVTDVLRRDRAYYFEVERKRRLPDDGARLVQQLVDLGWTASEPQTETDTYYSRPDVDYMQTVECLRVRRRGSFAEVTYKPPSTAATHSTDSVISKPETNVHLATASQAAQADQLLQAIGMRPLVRVEENRTPYSHALHPGVTVAIDKVAGAGAFVETEAISVDAEAAAEAVEQTEKDLQVTDLPTVDLPYRDLVLQSAQGV
ncbi:class IV adenylate cyclase [Streptomyces sp. NPDC004629]|uniref:class IV adenylate cyclase n=1 Tax=Streptomyces sp. NPDC004629 TaxID=3364705 RepID=UPI0036B0E721